MPRLCALPQLLPFHTTAYWLLLISPVWTVSTISLRTGLVASRMYRGSPATGAAMLPMADQLLPSQVAYERPSVPLLPLFHTSIALPVSWS